MHVRGIHALREGEEVRVQAQLKDRPAAGLARELGIDHLVAPVAERARRRHAQQQIRAPAPGIVQQRRLRDDLRAAAHRVERPIRERLRHSRALDLDDLVSLPGQVLQIVPLVDRATLHEDVEQRIVEMRPLDPAIRGLDVQVREVPAVEMPDEVGGAEAEGVTLLDHAAAIPGAAGPQGRPARFCGGAMVRAWRKPCRWVRMPYCGPASIRGIVACRMVPCGLRGLSASEPPSSARRRSMLARPMPRGASSATP